MRAYFRSVGERFVEGTEVEGHRIAFYLPDRDVAITFDPDAFFAIDRTDTTAVLVEHELPGWGIGRRLPFETPDDRTDRRSGPAAGRDVRDRARQRRTNGEDRGGAVARADVVAAFDALDVSPDADPGTIREAYRDRVKDVHPDQGGDKDAFARLQAAYATAREHADG
jgi:hypothetical protein